jgi:hypothetical protein
VSCDDSGDDNAHDDPARSPQRDAGLRSRTEEGERVCALLAVKRSQILPGVPLGSAKLTIIRLEPSNAVSRIMGFDRHRSRPR